MASTTLVLKDNAGDRGAYRKEARTTNNGVMLFASQNESINPIRDKPTYDYRSFALTNKEMDTLAKWWLRMRGGD